MMEKSLEKIYALDLFRFVVAFIVFLFHLNIHLGVEIPEYYLSRFVNQGAICMSAFFMLSGFVLSYVYHQKKILDSGGVQKFYIKRFCKIYPSYIIAVLLFWILNKDSVTTISQNLVLVPMQLFVLQGYFSSTFNYVLNGGVWFVSVVFFLYLLFPFLDKGSHYLKKYPAASFLFLYFASIYPSIIQIYFGETSNIYINPLFRLPEFAIGLLMGGGLWCGASCANARKSNGWLVLAAIIFLIIGVAILSKNNFLNHVGFKNNYTYYNVICIPLFAFIIYHLGFIRNLFFMTLVKSKIVSYLSKISYSFFLTQGFAIMMIRNFFAEFNKGAIFVLAFMFNLIFAAILYEVIEKRVSEKLLNYFSQK